MSWKNDQVSEKETKRILALAQKCLVVSGIDGIGRKAYARATLKDTALEVIGSSSLSENSTLCDGNKQDIMRINLYLKYRDGISLRIGKHGELRMTCKLDKYFNTKEIPIKDDEYHKKLYELCKEYNIEEIKNLINSKK